MNGRALLVALVAVGCQGPPPSDAPTRLTPSALMPGPQMARGELAVSTNQRCVFCHDDIARTWEPSLHHQSNTDPEYQRSFAREPIPFCRGCHAPETERPWEAETAGESALGVGCVTCHLTREGTILAAPKERASEVRAPHDVVRSELFASDAACAGCHEFAFPNAMERAESLPAPSLMQSTVLEHRASHDAARPCASCHMPVGPEGRRSHAFVGSRDGAFIASALRLEVARPRPEEVRVRLTPTGAGHHVPTGDLFRRLRVSVVAARETETAFLGRHWGSLPAPTGREFLGDSRVGPLGQDVHFLFPGLSEGAEIVVAYERVAHPNGEDPMTATVEASLELFRVPVPAVSGARGAAAPPTRSAPPPFSGP